MLEATGARSRIVLGPAAVVGAGCELRCAAGASIVVDGELGPGCRLVAHEEVVVEAGARLGEGCVLIDADHVTDDPERPVRLQGLRTAPVRVERDAVLGPRVAVLLGVTVGAGAVVLAGSVVSSSVPPGAEVQGTPARIGDGSAP